MPAMVVTLEVSQLEKSALKFGNIEKRWLMSVMPETHQSAIGPYVAMAAAGPALYARTAVRREALVVKVFWVVQATNGGLGDGSEGGGDAAQIISKSCSQPVPCVQPSSSSATVQSLPPASSQMALAWVNV